MKKNDVLITEAPLQPFVVQPPQVEVPKPAEELPIYYDRQDESKVGFFEKVIIMGKLAPHFVKFIYGVVMRNWKTTLTALLGGIAALLSHFGVVIPQDWFEPIIAIGVIIIGFFTRDAGNGSDAVSK